MPETGVQDVQSEVSELKVSGHTMSLEPGVYCVFSSPGGPAPDAASGLPCVRISAAPGRGPGQLEVVGLDPNGWIGPDAATLVRVMRKSELLVTVFQSLESKGEAPQLQVVRVSGASPAAKPAAAAPVVASGAAPEGQRGKASGSVEVVAHVYGRGDVPGMLGEWIGEPGSKRWIEGFGVALAGAVPLADIEYQAVLGRGWLSPWSEGGQFCGSRGMSLPILGLRVQLRGKSAATHRVLLSASFVDGTRVGPVADGEACEAPSLAALEAFNVVIEPLAAKGVGAAAGAKAVRGAAVAAPAGRGTGKAAVAESTAAALAKPAKGKAAAPAVKAAAPEGKTAAPAAKGKGGNAPASGRAAPSRRG